MSKKIRLRKGLNIKLQGKAEKIVSLMSDTKHYTVCPSDFTGIIPKMLVNEGDFVKAGSPLFQNKSNESIVVSSPVSGKVQRIVRGEKRILEQIQIESDGRNESIDFGKAEISSITREAILEKLLKSGLWVALRQRPYHKVANPEHTPKAIFISAFDTAPLAPDYDFIMYGQEEFFQKGVDVLKKLTNGKLHLNISDKTEAPVFLNCKNTEINVFSGKHPAGNVGVQIHHIDPVNKGEVVWYVNPQHVIMIGKLFDKGIYDATKIVALTGSEVKNPQYYRMISGVSLEGFFLNKLKQENVRIISGNVLTGKRIEPNGGSVGFYDSQLSIIPEGTYYEFFGWASPGFKKFSPSRTFLSWLFPKKNYTLDTNYHGGERAFVMSGQYEQVVPMDILPVHLLKAILIEDIELMEKLGIYEIADEDFALCEYVCTSKIEVQSIIRKGLELMQKEMAE